MGKKIRFPLDMKDGVGVRTLEELKCNFDVEKILLNYETGKLITWLNDRYYSDLVLLIEHLDRSSEDFVVELCKIFGMDFINESNDMDNIHERSIRIVKLKKYSDDIELINNIDQVAFNQEELYDLLDEGNARIYLCGERFRIPVSKDNITYIGVDETIAIIESDKIINWASKNIVFKNIKFDNDYQKLSNNLEVIKAEKWYIAGKVNEAFEIFRREAENNSGRAMFYLGKFYDEGIGNVSEDKGLSKKWYLRGCEVGEILAKVNFALSIDDKIKKIEIVKNCLDELQQLSINNVVARYELALLYKNENEIFSANKKYIEYLELAANDGYWMAMNDLGFQYFNGKIIEKDYTKSIYWIKKAANLGYTKAVYGLAYCYENGFGVTRDVSEAVSWYSRAAEQGDGEAANKLGMAYFNGEGVEKNTDKENEWFLRGAELGDMDAQYNYGINCRDGYGMQVDLEKAFKYFEKAASQGKAGAQNEMGIIYLSGEPVAKDYEKAVSWFLKAANQGYADAQNRLAIRYANGQGVEKNGDLEFFWYSKAAENNHEKAINNLKTLLELSNEDCNFIMAIENCVLFAKYNSYNYVHKECEIIVAETYSDIKSIYKCEPSGFATTFKSVHDENSIVLLISNAEYITILHYAKGGSIRVVDKWGSSMVDEGYLEILDGRVEYGQCLLGNNEKRGSYKIKN